MVTRLGTVEEWTYVNHTGMDHPMHLHVWPMQVVAVDGRPVEGVVYQDVVRVSADGETTVRIPFEDFDGRTVHHCHINGHGRRDESGGRGPDRLAPAAPESLTCRFGARLGRHRWVAERTPGWLLSYKRLARRYDRTAVTITALARLAVTLICARRLPNN